MHRAMLNKSLVQFSVDGWGCVPSLLFDLGPNYGGWTSLVAQTVKCLSTIRETWVPSLGWEDPLEKEMGNHFSVLALRTP